MNLTLRSGVDLVSADRVRAYVDSGGSAFNGAVWTASEQQECAGDAARLAGRWGVKEAVMKALGRGWPDISWTDIEVVGAAGAPPVLALAGGAAAAAVAAGLDTWSISISHEGDLAVALAVAVGTTGKP